MRGYDQPDGTTWLSGGYFDGDFHPFDDEEIDPEQSDFTLLVTGCQRQPSCVSDALFLTGFISTHEFNWEDTLIVGKKIPGDRFPEKNHIFWDRNRKY